MLLLIKLKNNIKIQNQKIKNTVNKNEIIKII